MAAANAASRNSLLNASPKSQRDRQGTEAARPVRITDVSAAVGKPNPAFVYWLAA
jgi:hypothetical protein